MPALQALIVTNNKQHKAAVSELRNQLQKLTDTRPPPMSQPNQHQQINQINDTIRHMNSGESTANSSFNSHCSQHNAIKKLYPLPKFEGDPESWPSSSIPISKISFALRKPYIGAAHETVESLLSSTKNVKAVVDILKETNGRPEILIKSQIQNITEGRLDQLIMFARSLNPLMASTSFKSLLIERVDFKTTN